MIEIVMSDPNVMSAADESGALEAFVFEDERTGIMVRVNIGVESDATKRAMIDALEGKPPPRVPIGSLHLARSMPPHPG